MPTARHAPNRTTWRDRHPAEMGRLVIYVALLCASLIIPDGSINFAVNAVGLIASLALTVLRVPRFYRLHMVWTIAYLYVIVREGYFGADDIAQSVAWTHYDVASSYLNAANALVLLGHAIVFRERPNNAPLARPLQWSRRARAAVAPQLYLIGSSLAYFVMILPQASGVLAVGRVGVQREGMNSVGDAVTLGLLSGAALALPALNTYYLLYVARLSAFWAVVVCLPFFAIQFAIGTRFVLLMALLGALLVYLSAFPLTRQTLPRMFSLLPVGFLLYVASVLMKQLRVLGLGGFEIDRLVEELVGSPAGGYEGCVALMTKIVAYFDGHEFLYGRSSGNLLIFWIPRAIWPDKPTLLGYWFPRAFGDTGYSSSHSVSSGFPADFYVDFGFWGGLACAAVLGLIAGRLERSVARMIDHRTPWMVLATTMYGATFFAVRSPQTTVIVMSGVLVLTAGFVWSLPRFKRLGTPP